VGFNLENYEPVDVRIEKFYRTYADGRIITELVSHGDGEYIVKALVYRHATDGHVAASGYAHEETTQRGVNSTSALENCETSAIGRALANLGFAAKGERPSREEMEKVQRHEGKDNVKGKECMGCGKQITGAVVRMHKGYWHKECYAKEGQPKVERKDSPVTEVPEYAPGEEPF
jgi:hypothetical protein